MSVSDQFMHVDVRSKANKALSFIFLSFERKQETNFLFNFFEKTTNKKTQVLNLKAIDQVWNIKIKIKLEFFKT